MRMFLAMIALVCMCLSTAVYAMTDAEYEAKCRVLIAELTQAIEVTKKNRDEACSQVTADAKKACVSGYNLVIAKRREHILAYELSIDALRLQSIRDRIKIHTVVVPDDKIDEMKIEGNRLNDLIQSIYPPIKKAASK